MPKRKQTKSTEVKGLLMVKKENILMKESKRQNRSLLRKIIDIK